MINCHELSLLNLRKWKQTHHMRLLVITNILFHLLHATAFSQSSTLSGRVMEKENGTAIRFASLALKKSEDSSFVTGVISDTTGRYRLNGIKAGYYLLSANAIGYLPAIQQIFVGSLTSFLDIKPFLLEIDPVQLATITINSEKKGIALQADRMSFNMNNNITQTGGSILQAIQKLPGIALEDGKVLLRGSDKVIILIDGKQTALTGFGSQSGLDNLPASALDRIEIIQNPSAKYDANGTAGIINLIYKKSKQDGFNGKSSFTYGSGALWEKKNNLPDIRPQYRFTPKINPSLNLNYRRNKTNLFFSGDYLYTETLNKNEFVERSYENGEYVRQQTKRNRNTHFVTLKSGLDLQLTGKDILTVSGMLGTEKIIDNGDEPFFNQDLTQRLRYWKFLEDELKTTIMATAVYQHAFSRPGQLLNLGYNYTFHREDEQYFFDNILPNLKSKDAFKLLSDEQVSDFNVDYTQPLQQGRFETGLKFRHRSIPTNMQFFPGIQTAIDVNAGGWANYREIIPALYGNYVYESPRIETEVGVRAEYMNLQYEVNPNHNTYKSDGYSYAQPFPTVRFAFKNSDHSKWMFNYNRRVDRPNEVDIRIFPKYDDAEIIKVGNPGLRPQFSNSFELGYRMNIDNGFVSAAFYNRFVNGTITRIASYVPGSRLIYAVFQNAGKSRLAGLELIGNKRFGKVYQADFNLNIYHNRIDPFTVVNKYPTPRVYVGVLEQMYSGNIKLNQQLTIRKNTDFQVTMIYLAPDIIPQGRIGQRFSLDAGFKSSARKGKLDWFANATDLLNTMNIRKTIQANGFSYTSTDYLETQVVRIGLSMKL